jgi:hypothetical protein
VDHYAEALIFIQWIAFSPHDIAGSAGNMRAMWPVAVQELRFAFGAPTHPLQWILEAILAYSPAEWRGGHVHALREWTTVLWKTALGDRVLFGNDDTFGTLTMYYASLNYHAVEKELPT